MTKQTITFLLGFTLFINQATGQAFKQQYNDLVSKKDTVGQIQLLEKWEKVDKNDPELYVAYFNYYFLKSRKEVVRIDNNPKGDKVLQIMDNDTSKKEPIAYMYGDTYYDPEILKEGYNYIDKGIEKNPARLDMRFGKVYTYGQTKDYENFTTEIINTINYSAVINNKWTWSDNKPVEDPNKFMLSCIQDYVRQLFDTQNDSLLDNMKRISETVLKYHPNHVESLSNISIVYTIKKDYNKALTFLLKAEKIDPKDYIVLSNIAHAYKLKGDKVNAIKYYELTTKYGDDQAKEYANEQLKDLKKQ
jgi:tetratricopeptide (TPR) repeat protein